MPASRTACWPGRLRDAPGRDAARSPGSVRSVRSRRSSPGPPVEGDPGDPRGQGGGERCERININPDPRAPSASRPSHLRRSKRPNRLLPAPGSLRRGRDHRFSRQHAGDARREMFREIRQELVADAVAGNGDIRVGRVLAKRQPSRLASTSRSSDRRISMSGRITRPDPWPDPGEPTRPGPPHEPQQERLRLVVDRVRHRDRIGGEPVGCLLEEGVAQLARHVFDGPALLARARRLTSNRPISIGMCSRREVLAEPLVGTRRRPRATGD
jgi:hypothetical protein